MAQSLVDFLCLLLKGILIGVANIIPGVSGGTIAVSLGIYQPLIDAVSHFPLLIKDKRQWPTLTRFLLPLFIGLGLGIVLFAKAMSWLLQYQPVNSQLFFVGLILGATPLILKLGNIKAKPIIAGMGFLLGLIIMGIVFYLSMQQETRFASMLVLTNERLQCLWFQLKMLGCGFVAAFAMVIPGISGSLLLVILGEYTNILALISRVTSLQGDLSFGYSVSALGLFAVGILIGIISCAKSMSWFLKNHKTFTMSFILGLMLFSILSIWPTTLADNVAGLLINTLCIVMGTWAAYTLGKQS